MRGGSLFSGYGGLDLGVAQVLDVAPAWFAEHEPPSKQRPKPSQAPARIVAHHWPTVPNLGDVSLIDWSSVAPVEVLTGGFPCTDISTAGARRGLIRSGADATRSGLWGRMRDAIAELRPRLVFIENVRGLLSARADSTVEPCPWCMGDIHPDHVLRALGAVLGDLADLGYDARWHGLRAADIGAPHGRFRVFIAAYPRGEAGRLGTGLHPHQSRRLGRGRPDHHDSPTTADPGCDARPQNHEDRPAAAGRGRELAADTARDGRGEGRTEPARIIGRPDASQRGSGAAADSDSHGRALLGRQLAEQRDTDGCGGADIAWGIYEPAIRRWERTIGRPAPAPTIRGAQGGAKLNPALVEWMMGLPLGHVTDPVIGISVNDQLRALGNGVVPQQAAAALRILLDDALFPMEAS